MRWTPFPLVGGAYADDAKPFTAQDTVNCLVEMAEKQGARTPAVLRPVPGLIDYCTAATHPVRGLHDVEGALFAVAGKQLYRVQNGAATALGTIPGVGRVSMAHNHVTGGSELLIVTGSTGWVWNTTTETLVQATDSGFPGAKITDFTDQYLIGVEPSGRFWYHSDLSAALEYNTLDQYTAESAPDAIVTAIVSHGDVLVFGKRTGEFFYNSGAATGTFQRREGTTMEVGCAGTHAVARIDNSVVWLGHDGTFYRLEGYSPVRISTHAIEQAIADEAWHECVAQVFEDRGHKVVYFTFTNGKTWGYDVATREWHRRQSHGMDRWRVSCLAKSGSTWYAGDAFDGSIYTLDWARCSERGEALEYRRIAGPLHDDGNRLGVNALRVDVDTGQPGDVTTAMETGPDLSDPGWVEPPLGGDPVWTGEGPPAMLTEEVTVPRTIRVRTSKDGGYVFSDWRTRDLGATGAFLQELIWRRFGSAKHWTLEVSVISAAPALLMGSSVQVEPMGS